MRSAARKLAENRKATIERLWPTGMSTREIGELVGLTQHEVSVYRRKLGLPPRSGHNRVKAPLSVSCTFMGMTTTDVIDAPWDASDDELEALVMDWMLKRLRWEWRRAPDSHRPTGN